MSEPVGILPLHDGRVRRGIVVSTPNALRCRQWEIRVGVSATLVSTDVRPDGSGGLRDAHSPWNWSENGTRFELTRLRAR